MAISYLLEICFATLFVHPSKHMLYVVLAQNCDMFRSITPLCEVCGTEFPRTRSSITLNRWILSVVAHRLCLLISYLNDSNAVTFGDKHRDFLAPCRNRF